ncbi:MAG: hypothetical protein Q9209_003848 [Squamulea sp. 1 TL-2023]
MSSIPPLPNLALYIRDYIATGTFDVEVFNRYLQPHAALVLQPRPGVSTRTPGPVDRCARAGGFGHRVVVGTANPILEWEVPTKKRRLLSSNHEGPRLSSSDPEVVSIVENHNGSENPDIWSPNASNILLREQQNPLEIIHGCKILEQQLAKRRFLARWEELAKRGTESRVALEKLCRFDNLPPINKPEHELKPYTELDKFMTYLCDWGSSQVQTEFISNLYSLMASGRAISPSFSRPYPLDDLEITLQEPLQQHWRASQITDFWAQSKDRDKVLWRLCVLKEARHYQQMVELSNLEDQTNQKFPTGITKSALTPGKIKEQLFRMYAKMCPSRKETLRLKQRFENNLALARPYLALQKHYQNDGIIAMIPSESCESTTEALRLAAFRSNDLRQRRTESTNSYQKPIDYSVDYEICTDPGCGKEHAAIHSGDASRSKGLQGNQPAPGGSHQAPFGDTAFDNLP